MENQAIWAFHIKFCSLLSISRSILKLFIFITKRTLYAHIIFKQVTYEKVYLMKIVGSNFCQLALFQKQYYNPELKTPLSMFPYWQKFSQQPNYGWRNMASSGHPNVSNETHRAHC